MSDLYNVTGVVGAESTRMVTTRYGSKPVYSYDVGGTQVEIGFKKLPAFRTGDTVRLTVEHKYGVMQLKSQSNTPGIPDAPTGVGSAASTSGESAKPVSYGKPFPLPDTHGDMSIIRQSSLKCAVDLVIAASDDEDTLDSLVDHAIGVAYKLAAFSSGRLDRERAEEVAKHADPK